MRIFSRPTAVFFLLLLFYTSANAQQNWKGVVLDSVSKEPLPGVVIAINEASYTTSDLEGKFNLTVTKLPEKVTFVLMGYTKKTHNLNSISSKVDTIFLKPENMELGIVIVSASRQEQKIEEITQSVELVDNNFLQRTQTIQLQDAIQRLPGVQVQKGQVSMRGGSGFSYGSGSRVMVLIDDMPMLSADAGDAKWSYYPVENLQQVEVLKGASSALYGSSALEGIIHLRTAIAADTTFTEVKLWSGFYDKPARKNLEFEQHLPGKYGVTLSHRQKFGIFRTTASASYQQDKSYRIGENETLYRANIRTVFAIPKNTKWSFALAAGAGQGRGENYLFFPDVNQPFTPYAGTVSDYVNTRYSTDFQAKNYISQNSSQSFKTRLFTTINTNNTGQSSTGRLWFNEYLYQHILQDANNSKSSISTGATYILTQTFSDSLYGNHNGHNTAIFTQLNHKTGRLNSNFGFRLETNKVDTLKWEYFPVFRGGLNFAVTEGGHLRFSLGQGFRYPSVAERFARTQSGAINIFPNPELKPETGWSAELGYKQFFKKGKIKGYADGVFFWTEYQNMIEYTFGFYPPPGYDPFRWREYLGFKGRNIASAKINGVEFSTAVQYESGKLWAGFYGGYTYIWPINQAFGTGNDTLPQDRFLRYRRKHLVRANFDVGYGKVSMGFYATHNSRIMNIDQFFLATIAGLKQDDYWQKISSGTVLDARFAVKFWRNSELAFIVKNFLNEEYMEVIGNINATRSFNIQFVKQF